MICLLCLLDRVTGRRVLDIGTTQGTEFKEMETGKWSGLEQYYYMGEWIPSLKKASGDKERQRQEGRGWKNACPMMGDRMTGDAVDALSLSVLVLVLMMGSSRCQSMGWRRMMGADNDWEPDL
jgi:hypothetical protein